MMSLVGELDQSVVVSRVDSNPWKRRQGEKTAGGRERLKMLAQRGDNGGARVSYRGYL